jgi:hypothetical protein
MATMWVLAAVLVLAANPVLLVTVPVPPTPSDERSCGSSMACFPGAPNTSSACSALNDKRDGYVYVARRELRTPPSEQFKHCPCLRCAAPHEESPTVESGACATADCDWRRICGEAGGAMRIDELNGVFADPRRARLCAAAYTAAVAAHVRAFAAREALTAARAPPASGSGVCVATLLGGSSSWYLSAHLVFVREAIRVDPAFSAARLIVIDGVVGSRLNAAHRAQLAASFRRIHFYEPLLPVWPANRTMGGGKRPGNSPFLLPVRGKEGWGASSWETFSPDVALSFYLRLQAFLFGQFCGAVISIDTGDMLPLKPFIAPAVAAASARGFAAAPLCEQPRYFNAGFFAIGRPFLKAQNALAILREAMLIARAPPCRDRLMSSLWFADQSVLNILFSEARFRSLSPALNDVKTQWLLPRGSCHSGSAILHFLGPKPWAPLSARHMPRDLNPVVRGMEGKWWAAYFADKTVVVGSGPSTRAPLGTYIDTFANVIRINDFHLDAPSKTGARTTHVFLHSATKPSSSLLHAARQLPRERVFLAPFGAKPEALEERMLMPSGTGLRLANVTVLSSYYHRKLVSETGARSGVPVNLDKHALTGTIAVAWALKHIAVPTGPVFLVGFDMTLGNGTDSYKHADYTERGVSGAVAAPKRSLDIFHNVRADRGYINSLVGEGMLASLADLPLYGPLKERSVTAASSTAASSTSGAARAAASAQSHPPPRGGNASSAPVIAVGSAPRGATGAGVSGGSKGGDASSTLLGCLMVTSCSVLVLVAGACCLVLH